MAAAEARAFDVIIVGGGVVGTAVARELSQYQLRVGLVEARNDVGAATSKANTAILHTGFDATPGTVESTMVRRGYDLLGAYCADHSISVERTGAVLVAWDDEQVQALESLRDKAERNGYLSCRLIDAQEVGQLEPSLGPGALGGLLVPGESLIDPWSVPLAFAAEAVRNGVELRLNCAVERIDVGAEQTVLHTNSGTLTTRYLVNAAGLGADLLDRQLGHERFNVVPRRGQLIVFDKLARPLVRHIVLPVPSKMGKGVLVSPTVFGNVMVGPTAEDLADRSDTASTVDGIEGLLAKAARIVPQLVDYEITATYAGLRAATEHSDYCLSFDADQRLVTLGGIRSTGLTASMALGEWVRDTLHAAGLVLEAKPERDLAVVVMSPLGERDQRPWQSGGHIVCHCERVTEAEIVAACSFAVPPADLDGLRRRTRALLGRCQGFYCMADVDAIFAQHRRDETP
jgi:glycerol-3-phosphate dehydrogenase